MNNQKQMIYIGETDNFQRRMAEHVNDSHHCMHRYGPSLVYAEVIQSDLARRQREAQLIAEYQPICNQT